MALGEPAECPTSPLSQQMQQVTNAMCYLEQKGVRNLLKDLTEALLVDRPSDPASYIVDSLQKVKVAGACDAAEPSRSATSDPTEVACCFLESRTASETSREAVQRFLELAKTKCPGAVIEFFSAPSGRGRQVQFLSETASQSQGFLLVASSQSGESEGREASPEASTALREAVDRGSHVDGLMAASSVRTSAGLEGVLLTTFAETAAGSPSGEQRIQTVRLWSLTLAERIEVLQLRSQADDRSHALNDLQFVIGRLVEDGDYSDLNVLNDIAPSDFIRGGVQLDNVALWSHNPQTDELCLNNSGKMDGAKLEAASSIVGKALACEGKVVCCEDPQMIVGKDDKALEIICGQDQRASPDSARFTDEQKNLRSESTILVPLPPLGGCGRTVVQFTNFQKPDQKLRRISHWDLVAAENLSLTVLPCVMQLHNSLMELLEKRHQRVHMQNLVSECSTAITVQDSLRVIRRALPDMLDCESCYMYFYDDEENELWEPDGVRIEVGNTEKFVCHVADLAMQSQSTDVDKSCDDCPSVFVLNERSSCSRWDCDAEDFFPLNMMTAPIWSVREQDRQLLGVVQVVNKKGKHSVFDYQSGFSSGDVTLFETAVVSVGSQLQRLMLDLMWTKARMGDSQVKGGEDSSMVSEYFGRRQDKQRTVIKSTWSQHGDAGFGELDMKKRRKKKRNTQIGADIFTLLNLGQVKKQSDIQEWHIDYWSLAQEDELGILIQAFKHCDVHTSLNISTSALINFFTEVKASYRDNPYHNFQHALSTLHYSFKFMIASDLRASLSQSDIFAMIVAAFCHDCDHRGFNSAYETITRSELALRYNDKSPLENHHCARAFEIALASENNSCNIFESLEPSTYNWVRSQIVAGILGTDMKVHGEHVQLMQEFNLEPGRNPDQSQFLVETLIHVADIGNPMMPCDISQRWGKALAEEFASQAETEERLGLPVTPFMQGLRDPIAAAKSQVGFVDFVLMPLVSPMFRIWRGLTVPEDFLAQNRENSNNVVIDAGGGPKVISPKQRKKLGKSRTCNELISPTEASVDGALHRCEQSVDG